MTISSRVTVANELMLVLSRKYKRKDFSKVKDKGFFKRILKKDKRIFWKGWRIENFWKKDFSVKRIFSPAKDFPLKRIFFRKKKGFFSVGFFGNYWNGTVVYLRWINEIRFNLVPHAMVFRLQWRELGVINFHTYKPDSQF